MTSSERKTSPVIQKEWTLMRKGSSRSFFFIRDYPFEIDSKFKSKLAYEKELVGELIRIHPVEENIAWNIITRESGRRSLRLMNNERLNDRNQESNKLTLQNIQGLRDEVASGKAKMIKYSCAYFLQGESTKITEIRKNLLHFLKKLGVKAENKRYSDAKVRNRLITGDLEGIYLDPDSVSNLIPVNHGYLFHETGTYYGVCEISNAPVFMDRSTYPSSHQLVLGMTGFGKSFFVKATMLREKIARKVNIKVIDPLGEYGNFSESIGARTFDLVNQEMNMFEKIQFLSVKENVDRTLALLMTLFNLDNEDGGIIDTGLTIMYERGENLEFLKDYIRSHTSETYNKVSPVFEGSFKKFCSGKNPNLSGDVRINLKNVPKKLLSFYMLLSLDLLMRSSETESTNLVIDEAHYLLQESVVAPVERYIRHARHGNVSVILLSQSANDFLKNASAITIMENCSIHVLFRHQVITDEMIKFYSLDDSLTNFLKNAAGFNGKNSRALFFSPGFKTMLKFESNPTEIRGIDGIPKS